MGRFKETKETLRCDCCNKKLIEPSFYINDGSFQDTYIRIHDKELCFTCAGRILSYIKPDKEIIEEEIEGIQKRDRRMFPSIDGLANLDLNINGKKEESNMAKKLLEFDYLGD